MKEWRRLREEYELVRIAAYQRAEEATCGRLLNRRGVAASVDPFSLFMGNAVTAYAYASEELVEHWRTYPRLTFAKFEEMQQRVYVEAW